MDQKGYGQSYQNALKAFRKFLTVGGQYIVSLSDEELSALEENASYAAEVEPDQQLKRLLIAFSYTINGHKSRRNSDKANKFSFWQSVQRYLSSPFKSSQKSSHKTQKFENGEKQESSQQLQPLRRKEQDSLIKKESQGKCMESSLSKVKMM